MSETVRQSTARTVMVGPILDATGVAVTDGVVGDLKISKNGAAPAALNGSATLTHRHTGHYSLALTASDLDTVGTAQITIDDTVNCMPPKELTVIEEAVYDAVYVAAAAGYQVPIWAAANSTVNLSATTVKTATDVETDTADIQTRLPAALTADGNIKADTLRWGGTLVASANVLIDGAITAAKIASDAITAAKIADNALTAAKFASGAFDAVWTVTTRELSAFSASFKTGYALSSAGVQAIWDAATSALTTVGSIGKLLVDNINATISSRSSHSAADVWAVSTRRVSDATNITSTGGTTVPQTGDSFARIGAPVGASISADIAAVQADLPQRITKNTALAAFEFTMVSSSDHVTGATGLTVTATRSLDGAAFGACANSVSEVSAGVYKIDLAAGDLNGNTVTLKFAATGADTRIIHLVTQPT